MAELPERDSALLLDMLLAARDARAFVKGLDERAFLASLLHQNAAIRSLEIIGEAAGKVSVVTQTAHPEIPWREITGMRHPSHPRLWRRASRPCLDRALQSLASAARRTGATCAAGRLSGPWLTVNKVREAIGFRGEMAILGAIPPEDLSARCNGVAQHRIDTRVPASAVEDAVMADARLQMMGLHIGL